jgi:hypothetical protein
MLVSSYTSLKFLKGCILPCVAFGFNSHMPIVSNLFCHNLSLGLTTKTRACKGAGQEWSLGDTFHVPRSVGECEGMNSQTPKWAPTYLGVRVPMDS